MFGPTIVPGKSLFRLRRARDAAARRSDFWLDRSDDLDAARGVLTGVGLGIGMWSFILVAAFSARFI